MEKLKLTVAEICAAANESHSVVYDGIRKGHLKTFLVGRRRFARPSAVREWIDFLEAESDAGRPVLYRPRGATSEARR